MNIQKYLSLNDNYIIIPFWVIIWFIFWIQVMPQTESVTESLLFSTALILSIYPVATHLSKTLLLKAMKEKKTRKFTFQFISLSFVIGAFLMGYVILFNYLENQGVFPISRYFKLDRMPVYFLFVPISAGLLLNICICGIRFFLEYIKLQKTILEYQLQILQQQINPHFMFNVLNHIYILMKKDVELASDLLVNYSEVLRYQLYNGKLEYVALGEEIQFLKEVINVEKMRWGNELQVNCQWDIKNKEILVRPLIFISFVENAFKHVSRSISETGYINIICKQEENHIYLEIENSKSKQQAQKINGSGIGLKNTIERLSILYPNKHKLEIKENDQIYIIQLNITL